MAHFDVAIIGGGTGGYSAALRAAENGLKVALIEKEKIGGTCLHKGCIPTKALIEASSLYSRAKESPLFGINHKDLSIDWTRTQKYKTDVVNELYNGLLSLIKARAIDVIKGEAKFISSKKVAVNGSEIDASSYVIATGSSPKSIDAFPNSELILDSDGILQLENIPQSLVIIGGGYIGIEFASLFNGIGCQVSVIEAAPDILMHNDEQIRQMLAHTLIKNGVNIETAAQIESVEEDGNKVTVIAKNSSVQEFVADKVLVAVGRNANTGSLGLENTSIEIEKGFVRVDENLMSAEENVYAIGDCINTPQLAHVSFAEGIAVADYIANNEAVFPHYNAIPAVVYSNPQLASVGMTQEEVEITGQTPKTAIFNFAANSKAVISNEKEGIAKIVADENDTILGIHIFGPDASNLISEAMLAVGWEAKIDELASLIHPHPTFSEVIGEAALKLTGKPLHSL